MLKAEGRMELEVLRNHGASIRELARMTGHSRNTVRRYLREGDAAATRKPAPKRTAKLDGFKDYIVARLNAAAPDRIPSTVLFREVKALGYRAKRGSRPRALRDRRYEWVYLFGAICPERQTGAAIIMPQVMSGPRWGPRRSLAAWTGRPHPYSEPVKSPARAP
jgi:hypothetical protein